MKSRSKKEKSKRPTTDRKALWPTDPLNDKHNEWVIKQLAEKAKEKRNV